MLTRTVARDSNADQLLCVDIDDMHGRVARRWRRVGKRDGPRYSWMWFRPRKRSHMGDSGCISYLENVQTANDGILVDLIR